MKPFVRSLVSLLVLGLLWTSGADAGWVIEDVMRSKGGGTQGRNVFVFSGNRIKTTSLDDAGKPTSLSIWDLDAETLTLVNHQDRTVQTGTVREFIESLRGATQAMAGEMAEAMKQMQEEMKKMPPEQRKMMEQMMRQSTPGGPPSAAAPGAEPCRQPRVEVRPAGQTARVAGFSATRYDVMEDGKPSREIWITKAITAWQEIDRRKLERHLQEMAKLMEALPGCGREQAGRSGLNPYDPVWKLIGEGYPVRTVHHGVDTIDEVVKAEGRSVPASEFQPPAGFKRQTFKEMMRVK